MPTKNIAKYNRKNRKESDKMKIDITKLLTNYVSSLKIKEEVFIPKDFLENSLIVRLENIILDGKLFIDEDNHLNLVGNLSGTMILKDDLTLDEVSYQFTTEIEEIFEKSKNILDITDILWQNILVEIPSKVRSTDGDINLEGNGWRVITEDQFNRERSTNNPFANLDKLLNTKEDR